MFHKLRQKPKLLYAIITAAGLTGFLASFLQMLEKIELLKNPSSVLLCNINAIFSCSNILDVWQSSVFGFPNSLMCIIFFVVTLTAGLIAWAGGSIGRILRLVLMGLAWFFVMFGFWYLWQSIFEIGALCIYCLVCYAAVLTISGAWLRLNYKDIKFNKKIERFFDYVVSNNFDIVFWLFIATLIAIEATIQFA